MPGRGHSGKLAPPFAEGNLAAATNGARVSAWRLEGRAAEIADGIRPDLGACDAGAEILLNELAVVLCRLEIAEAWLDEHGLVKPGKTGATWPVLAHVDRWTAQAARLVALLGLGPRGKGKTASTSDVLGAYLAGRDEGEDA